MKNLLNLVVVAKEIENKWLIMNRACLNPHYMEKLDELARTTSEVENHTFQGLGLTKSGRGFES